MPHRPIAAASACASHRKLGTGSVLTWDGEDLANAVGKRGRQDSLEVRILDGCRQCCHRVAPHRVGCSAPATILTASWTCARAHVAGQRSGQELVRVICRTRERVGERAAVGTEPRLAARRRTRARLQRRHGPPQIGVNDRDERGALVVASGLEPGRGEGGSRG